uniref:Small ribosomal subunit protein uS14c n=1 Tax=Gracilariopsis tenuifrons TaxID=31472 RepID=A0A345AIG8_9FLOR|nr:ribosomal protein S14 [Gracilariopsis tenuifrons]AXF36204.1 ribosomal protein S5 [Gracilariopsis tenuifrons]UAD89285.1 ribosomal protein S14 [Gracilariopsis tenuifrons]
MAKKSMIQREIKRSKLIIKYQNRRQNIKKQIRNASSFTQQIDLQKELQKLPRNSAPCRQRNRCWKTGRSRGFYKDFGLSRHVLREMSHNGLLPGIKKSSW